MLRTSARISTVAKSATSNQKVLLACACTSEDFCQTRQIPADALSATGSVEASHEELSPACSVAGRHSILNKRQMHLTIITATIERAGSSPVHLLSIWCCVCLVFLLLVLLLVFLLLRMHKRTDLNLGRPSFLLLLL